MHLAFFDRIGWDYGADTPYVQPLGGSQSALCYLAAELVKLGDTLPPSAKLKEWHAGVLAKLKSYPNEVAQQKTWAQLTSKEDPFLQKSKVGKFMLWTGEVSKSLIDTKGKPWTSDSMIHSVMDANAPDKTTGHSALVSYTGGGYVSMNAHGLAGEPLAKWTGNAKTLFENFDKLAKPIPEGTMLSRKFDAQIAEAAFKQAVGSTLVQPSFSSTSMSKNVWSGNVHMNITVAKGVKGIYAMNSSQHSGEREVVLNARQKYHLRGYKFEGGKHILDVVAIP